MSVLPTCSTSFTSARPWGRSTPSTTTSNGSLFTHPKDTGTQLEFYPHVMPSDPRFAPGWDGEWWAANHPLGVIARDDHTIVADPQKTFGAPFRFTTWDVPGGPRN